MNVFIIILIVVVVLCAVFLFTITPRVFNKPDESMFRQKLFAHRGLHDNEGDAPENSMKAFEKAITAGYGIETDVQLSKDKVPVIFHDFTLDRICGVDGKVADYTYEELQQFNLAKSQEKIPTFGEFLKALEAIEVTDVGIYTSDNDLQFPKANLSIDFTESGRSIQVSEEQP